MDMFARVLAADPFALARRQSDLAVDRQCQLQGDARTAAADAAKEAGEGFFGLPRTDADLYFDPRGFERFDPFARGARIGVDHCGDDARDTGFGDARCASWAPLADMGARLEAGVERCPARPRAG